MLLKGPNQKKEGEGNMRMMLIMCCCLMAGGCATITRGTTEALVINSVPPGAEVQLSNGMRCKTPCALEVRRKKDIVLTFEKGGYEVLQTTVISEVAGAGAAGMAGNVLVGGLIGVGVDAATGATKKLSPNPVNVTLTATGQQPAAVTQTAAQESPEAAAEKATGGTKP